LKPTDPNNPSAIDRLAQAAFEGVLTPEQRAELNAMLREDPAARRRFIETMDLHAALADASGPLLQDTPADLPDVLGELIDAAVDNRRRHNAELEASRALSASLKKENELRARREAARNGQAGMSVPPWIVWGGIVGAAAAIVLAFTALFPSNPPADPTRSAQMPGSGAPLRLANALPVGRITAVSGARWSDGRFATDQDMVYQGERVSLAAGVVEVVLNNGVVITLEGPAALTPVSDAVLSVDRGKMVCRVPEQVRGFAVQTDTLTINNSGNEFALQARPGRGCTVHALSGTVRLEPGRSARAFEPVVIEAGLALAVEGTGTPRAVATDPNAFYRVVPSAYEMYVHDLSPLAWWSFAEPVDGWLTDRGSAGADARAGAGLGVVDAPQGQAVRIDSGTEPLRLRDTGAFNLTRDFTIEAWVRVEGSTLHSSRVFSNRTLNQDVGFGFGLAGRSLASEITCRDAEGRLFQPDPLSLKFTLFGRLDLITQQGIPTGDWVQIVVVFSSDHPARLFINGEPARAGTQMDRNIEAYDLWRSAVRCFASNQTPVIGQNPRLHDPEPFVGDLDELVIYRQALSDRTVRALYERGVAQTP
jgi:hypothetical protein